MVKEEHKKEIKKHLTTRWKIIFVMVIVFNALYLLAFHILMTYL